MNNHKLISCNLIRQVTICEKFYDKHIMTFIADFYIEPLLNIRLGDDFLYGDYDYE